MDDQEKKKAMCTELLDNAFFTLWKCIAKSFDAVQKHTWRPTMWRSSQEQFTELLKNFFEVSESKKFEKQFY